MKTPFLNAEYIWTPESLPDKDNKLCFRKKMVTAEDIIGLTVEIWADSRYYLWINGDYIGTGPARCWPDYPEKDIWKIQNINTVVGTRTIQIAVLVWHYGTSTSQYIHGPAGLYAALHAEGVSGETHTEVTDQTWVCRIHKGFTRPVPRINVSQGWLEIYDDRKFPSDWQLPDFDDSDWIEVCLRNIGDVSIPKIKKLEDMPVRSVRQLKAADRQPVFIRQRQRVLCRGVGVRLDYKEVFYHEDRSTEDRLQCGYICCLVYSRIEQEAVFTLSDRCWPAVNEYIVFNGMRILIKPGCSEAGLRLKAGDNLLMIDVSGAKQRFTVDFHILSEQNIVFHPVLHNEGSPFAAVGPFETVEIGNIVCADGFDFEIGGEEYENVSACIDVNQLRDSTSMLLPVSNVLVDGVKLRSTKADKILLSDTPEAFRAPQLLEGSDDSGDYEIILDMGTEVSGFFYFSLECKCDAEIDFRFFEYLAGTEPEIPEDLDTSMRYICTSGSRQYYSLIRRGFRYVAVRLRAEVPMLIKSLGVDERLYPHKQISVMNTGDGLLDNIWLMCRRTVELCSEDTPVDSPAFEQAFWTGDAYVMALYNQYLSGDTGLIRHSLMLAARSMRYSPLPDCHLPAGVHLLLTAWAQMWILAVYDYWMHTADREFIREIFPWLKKAAGEFISRIGKDGLFKVDAWNMLDWAGMDTPYKGTIAHLNARLVECLNKLAVLSVVSGGAEAEKDRLLWCSRGETLARETDIAFWEQDRGCYIDSIHDDGKRSEVISVQTNLMMLIYGCVPNDRRESVKEFILNPPEDAVLPGSPFLAHFYYEFLFREGLGEKALSGIREQWGPMLEHGTCWETFIGFYKERLTRSYCHAWSSAPAYLFGAYILGVRVDEPGFKSIVISPNLSGLKAVSGRVPMPAGVAEISWKADNDGFSCLAILPAGTQYRFIPPPEYKEKSEIIVDFYYKKENS